MTASAATVRRHRSRRRAKWLRRQISVMREFVVDGRRLNRVRRMAEAATHERASLARVQGHARMAVIWSRQDTVTEEISKCLT